jgi:hypothetical protein
MFLDTFHHFIHVRGVCAHAPNPIRSGVHVCRMIMCRYYLTGGCLLVVQMLPPVGYIGQPASSFATKFVHMSWNKVLARSSLHGSLSRTYRCWDVAAKQIPCPRHWICLSSLLGMCACLCYSMSARPGKSYQVHASQAPAAHQKSWCSATGAPHVFRHVGQSQIQAHDSTCPKLLTAVQIVQLHSFQGQAWRVEELGTR